MSLEVRALTYTRGSFSLNSIAFTVDRGTVLGVGGQNGSGKSTLLKLLYGFLKTDSGTIVIDDTPISKMSTRELSRRIAVVNQEVSEPFNFTVRDVVQISGFSKVQEGISVQEALYLCGIPQLEDRPFSEISGGEKRLVMIAAAVYQDSDIILMDEPTAFLDVDKEMKVMNIIRNLKKDGKTLVLVLHDINLLYRLADRVVLLKNGDSVSVGNKDEVLTVDNLEKAYSVRFRVLEDGGPYKFVPTE